MATTYTTDLLERSRAYEAQPIEQHRSPEGLAAIAQLYAEITGQAVGGYRQCQYSDYRAVVTAYIREATRFFFPHLMAESSYTFAPQFANETISDGRYNKNVTAENLTDDDAKALLKLGYGHVIVKKGKEEAKADTASTDATEAEPTEAEKKAQADLKSEQKAHAATTGKLTKATEGLTAEKEAHKGTKKELADTKKLLADSEKKYTDSQGELAKVQQQLADATKPEADAN